MLILANAAASGRNLRFVEGEASRKVIYELFSTDIDFVGFGAGERGTCVIIVDDVMATAALCIAMSRVGRSGYLLEMLHGVLATALERLVTQDEELG